MTCTDQIQLACLWFVSQFHLKKKKKKKKIEHDCINWKLENLSLPLKRLRYTVFNLWVRDSKGAFHLSDLTGQTIPTLMRISLLIKTIQPDESNPKIVCTKEMVFQQNSWKKPISLSFGKPPKLFRLKSDQSIKRAHAPMSRTPKLGKKYEFTPGWQTESHSIVLKFTEI